MENSIELCENVSVAVNENANNSEIETKSIEEENKTSEEVTANFSETKEKEVKTLDTNKHFKWTNEATKAAACMLKDIIDEFNEANSDLSSSLDENTDPWGFDKLNEQMKVLKQSRELDLFPEEWCRFKLVSLLEKYYEEHTTNINASDSNDSDLYEEDNDSHIIAETKKKNLSNKYDFNFLYFVLSRIALENVYFRDLAGDGMDFSYNYSLGDDEDEFRPYLENYIEAIGYDRDNKFNTETILIANEIDYSFLCSKEFKEKFKNSNNIPTEFTDIYYENLFRETIIKNLPKFEDIDEINGLKPDSKKDYNLMLQLAECSYRSIDFLNIADAFITGEISNLKGLKETYSSMFEE